jgi:hypothetical protein
MLVKNSATGKLKLMYAKASPESLAGLSQVVLWLSKCSLGGQQKRP